MIACFLCPRPIYPGERTDLLNGHLCHSTCFADWSDDQREDAWASGEHADG